MICALVSVVKMSVTEYAARISDKETLVCSISQKPKPLWGYAVSWGCRRYPGDAIGVLRMPLVS